MKRSRKGTSHLSGMCILAGALAIAAPLGLGAKALAETPPGITEPASFPRSSTPDVATALEEAARRPGDAGALRALGDAYLEAGSPLEAWSAYNEAIRLSPSESPDRTAARAGIARIQRQAAVMHSKSGDAEGARRWIDAARAMDGGPGEVDLPEEAAETREARDRARQAIDERDPARALAILASMRGPASGASLALRAEAHLSLGRIAAAERIASRAAERDPRHPGVIRILDLLTVRQAEALAQQGDPVASLQALARLSDTRSQEALALHARLLVQTGDTTGAISVYEMLIARGAATPLLHAELARLYIAAGRLSELAMRYPSSAPSDPAAWKAEATRRERDGRLADAATAWGRVVAMEPADPEAWAEAARLRRVLGDTPRALINLREAIRRGRTDLIAEHIELLAAAGRAREAEQEITRILHAPTRPTRAVLERLALVAAHHRMVGAGRQLQAVLEPVASPAAKPGSAPRDSPTAPRVAPAASTPAAPAPAAPAPGAVARATVTSSAARDTHPRPTGAATGEPIRIPPAREHLADSSPVPTVSSETSRAEMPPRTPSEAEAFGDAHWAAGRIDEAVAAWEAVPGRGRVSISFKLAEACLLRGEGRRAERILAEMPEAALDETGNAQRAILRARVLLDAGDPAAAAALLEPVRYGISPASAWHILALVRDGRATEAGLLSRRDVIAILPAHARAEIAAALGDTVTAMALFASADPPVSERAAWRAWIRLLDRSGRHRAAAVLDRLEKKTGAAALAWTLRASSSIRHGDVTAAAAAARRALSLDPGSAELRIEAAGILWRAGRPGEAAAVVEPLVRTLPAGRARARALAASGTALLGLGLADEAARRLEEARAMATAHGDRSLSQAVAYNLALAERRRGEPGRVLRILDEAGIDHLSARLVRAAALIDLDRTSEAIAILESAAAASPVATLNYGILLRMSGLPADSIRVLRYLSGIWSAEALVHFHLGTSLEAAGETDKARESYLAAADHERDTELAALFRKQAARILAQ